MLFFRNHFPVDRSRPDTTKLERGLKPQPGALAACCQCAFRTVTEAAVPLTKTGSTVPSYTGALSGHVREHVVPFPRSRLFKSNADETCQKASHIFTLLILYDK